MTVIAISGAHGSGKSTLLEALKGRGFAVDDFKVSRAVQAALGYSTLQEATSTADRVIEFQTRIITEKHQHDLALLAKPGIILVERSFADIWTYTSHWIWSLESKGDIHYTKAVQFTSSFLKDCIAYQQAIYGGVVLVPLMPHIKREDDPNRADYSFADEHFDGTRKFQERTFANSVRTLIIDTKTVEQRVDQVEQFIKSLEGQK